MFFAIIALLNTEACNKSLLYFSAVFHRNKHGSTNLVDSAGYIYGRNQGNSVTSYWRCRNYPTCNAKAVTRGLLITKKSGFHNHHPPPELP